MCTKVISMPINAIIVEMEWRDIRFAQRISTASCGESLTFNDLTECVVARDSRFYLVPTLGCQKPRFEYLPDYRWLIIVLRRLERFTLISMEGRWSLLEFSPRAESCILRAILVAWTIRANWLWTLHCWVICRSERTIVSPSATPICLFCPITSPTQCITRLCS